MAVESMRVLLLSRTAGNGRLVDEKRYRKLTRPEDRTVASFA